MPILRIEIVQPEGAKLKEGLAQALADAAAQIFGTPTGETWVRLMEIPSAQYAENGVETHRGPYPVFVTIVRYIVPKVSRLEDESRALAKAFAAHLGRPVENIHLHFLPDGRSRFAFGGELVDHGPEGDALVHVD